VLVRRIQTIKGFIQNGQVVLPRPAELPDGTEVQILSVNGMESQDKDQPQNPEEIARVLALMDQVQPFEMTEQERAAWQADRQARQQWETTHFNEHSDKLKKIWP